jgi:hypothetical protein
MRHHGQTEPAPRRIRKIVLMRYSPVFASGLPDRNSGQRVTVDFFHGELAAERMKRHRGPITKLLPNPARASSRICCAS